MCLCAKTYQFSSWWLSEDSHWGLMRSSVTITASRSEEYLPFLDFPIKFLRCFHFLIKTLTAPSIFVGLYSVSLWHGETKAVTLSLLLDFSPWSRLLWFYTSVLKFQPLSWNLAWSWTHNRWPTYIFSELNCSELKFPSWRDWFL